MNEFNLLSKTELRIENILLQNVDLSEIAAVVADTLQMERSDVLVTDVQGETLTIDVLKGTVNVYDLIAKKNELLARLSTIPGVHVTEKTGLCAEGILGWVALDHRKAEAALRLSEKMAEGIVQRISERAMVFSTGFEVAHRQVKDTNTPTIVKRLKAEGYSVTVGPTLDDDELMIAARLREAVDDGYGLIITTGGVGAEKKDRTVEAVLAVDPEAATAYICKYQKGSGRHHKDGVRIGVGERFGTRIITLPGPNDEVRFSLDTLCEGLKSGAEKHELAVSIAENLQERLRKKGPKDDIPEDLSPSAGGSRPHVKAKSPEQK